MALCSSRAVCLAPAHLSRSVHAQASENVHLQPLRIASQHRGRLREQCVLPLPTLSRSSACAQMSGAENVHLQMLRIASRRCSPLRERCVLPPSILSGSPCAQASGDENVHLASQRCSLTYCLVETVLIAAGRLGMSL